MNDAHVAKQDVKYLNKYSHEAPYTLNCYSDVYQIIKLLTFIASKIAQIDLMSDEENVKRALFERLDITYSTALKYSIDTFIEAFDKAQYDHESFQEIKAMHQEYNLGKSSMITQ